MEMSWKDLSQKLVSAQLEAEKPTEPASGVPPHPPELLLLPLPQPSLSRVLSKGGRKRPQLAVDFDLSSTTCHEATTSNSSPEVSETVSTEDLGEAPKQRRRPVRLLTPSPCTSVTKAKAAHEFQPFERRGCLADPSSDLASKEIISSSSRQRCRPPGLLTPSPCLPKRPWGPQGHALSLQSPSVASSPSAGSSTPPQRLRQRSFNLGLLTPQSCTSNPYRLVLTPRTPEPIRAEMKLLTGCISVIFFDFDGTLTATPGHLVERHAVKTGELCERAVLLTSRLKSLCSAGILLGIISKSTEATVRTALDAAGLMEFFQGPVVGKAVGLEGKAGFIEDLVSSGSTFLKGEEVNLHNVLLIDDDVRELERARAKGVCTWPAPPEGGLQDNDFDDIFVGLGIHGFSGKGCGKVSTNGGATANLGT